MIYIPHKIATFNSDFSKFQDDPILVMAMRAVFDYANEMGLKGKRVSDLIIQPPASDPRNFNPLNLNTFIGCKIQCTQEERDQRLLIERYISGG